MALTTLDAKTALVVVDLQRGIVALPTPPIRPAKSSNARLRCSTRSAATACPSCS